jgi:predicted Zn-dependent protease
MIFTNLARKNGAASTLALAIALATGSALAATALETPAFAQKKEEESKPEYSSGFIESYKALETIAGTEPLDYPTLKAGFPGLIAAIENDDDRYAAGSFIYSNAAKQQDQAVALQGMEMMLQSGNVPQANLGQFNFVAGQLAYSLNDYAKARTYLQTAADAGYTDNDPLIFVAESYFAEGQPQQGLTYLSELINAKVAAGETVSEEWLRRGLAQAYNNQLASEANKYSSWYVSQYPGADSWGDAVAILLNTGGYENPEILDLLRLGQRVGVLRDDQLYLEYVEAADYRRLPVEVVSIIDEGYAAGKLDRTDPYVIDTRRQAAERAAQDRADIDGLIADANAADASINTVLAAGDTLLGLERPADAETFYAKALNMPGVNTPMVMTRLGIAQFDQGNYAEAEATFNKVEGARKAIANLWAIYATQQAAEATM